MTAQVAISFPVGIAPEPDRHEMTAEERKVYEALWHGAENARQIPTLAEATGINKRQVQSIIERLILEYHIPVGTSMSRPFGNYLIICQQDLRKTVQLLRDRGISNLVRAASLLGMELRLYLEGIQMELDIQEESASKKEGPSKTRPG